MGFFGGVFREIKERYSFYESVGGTEKQKQKCLIVRPGNRTDFSFAAVGKASLLLISLSSRKCTGAYSLLVGDVVDVLLRILMRILELKLRFQFNESAWDVDWRVNVSREFLLTKEHKSLFPFFCS